jgi:RNA polymerase sigma-70 factor, ECF subfamily
MVVRDKQSKQGDRGAQGSSRKISFTFFIQIFQQRCLSGESVNPETEHNGRWCVAWYDRLAANLLLYGRSLGLTHSEAEDVLQDTFAALLKLKESPTQPQHYILRAYRNRSLNYRRNWWRRLKAEWESAQWFEPSAAENPAEAAAMRCLAGLPVEQREVIVLKIWQRMTFEEIGQMLELSPNTAAGRFRYGVEKLRRAMNENGEEYEDITFEAIIGLEAPVGESGDPRTAL